MEITPIDENSSPVEIAVALADDETAVLARGAWSRLMRVFKTDEEHVREMAQRMLTSNELQAFLQEIVMANAAEQAFAALGISFVLTPKTKAAVDFVEGEPFEFIARAFPVPAMELDLETPIARPAAEPQKHGEADESGEADASEGPSDLEAHVRRVLGRRLHGSMPKALIDENLKLKKEAFERQLADEGTTYREYRIATGLKPAEVDKRLADEAFAELSQDIALEVAFAQLGLEATTDDELAVLEAAAPGHAADVRRDMVETGRICLLAQQTRRHMAMRWVMDNLVED